MSPPTTYIMHSVKPSLRVINQSAHGNSYKANMSPLCKDNRLFTAPKQNQIKAENWVDFVFSLELYASNISVNSCF